MNWLKKITNHPVGSNAIGNVIGGLILAGILAILGVLLQYNNNLKAEKNVNTGNVSDTSLAMKATPKGKIDSSLIKVKPITGGDTKQVKTVISNVELIPNRQKSKRVFLEKNSEFSTENFYRFNLFSDITLKLSLKSKHIIVTKENMWVYFKLPEYQHKGYFIITNDNSIYFTPAEEITDGQEYTFYTIINCIKSTNYTKYEAEMCDSPFFMIETIRIFTCKGIDYQNGSYFDSVKMNRLDR